MPTELLQFVITVQDYIDSGRTFGDSWRFQLIMP